MARFWRFFRTSPSSGTPGAYVGLEQELVPIRGHADQVPATLNSPLPTLTAQVEGVDFPFFSRFSDNITPLPQTASARRRLLALHGLMSTYGLGTPLPIAAAPPDTTPFVVGRELFDGALLGARRRAKLVAAAYQLALDVKPYPPAYIPASTYSTAVCALLGEIQAHLLETQDGGLTWGSGLWTPTEVVGYLNQRIARFLLETGLIQSRTTIAGAANQSMFDLPGDWIETRRAAWNTGGTTSELPREGAFTVDGWLPTWESVAAVRPAVYVEDPNPSLQVRVARTPSQAGTLDLIGIKQAATLTNDCSIIPLPDEWCIYVKWGIMADMLSKEGEAQDPERATLCEARFKEGINLAKTLLGEFEDAQ